MQPLLAPLLVSASITHQNRHSKMSNGLMSLCIRAHSMHLLRMCLHILHNPRMAGCIEHALKCTNAPVACLALTVYFLEQNNATNVCMFLGHTNSSSLHDKPWRNTIEKGPSKRPIEGLNRRSLPFWGRTRSADAPKWYPFLARVVATTCCKKYLDITCKNMFLHVLCPHMHLVHALG